MRFLFGARSPRPAPPGLAQPVRPAMHPDQPLTEHQRSLVAQDRCPRCRTGALDTGWECTSCGYDAMWIAMAGEPEAPGGALI